MPQIYLILGPEAKISLKQKVYGNDKLEDLGQVLIRAVESSFNIVGKHDVAFTSVTAEHTINEAGVQVEICYTAGEDEYGWGRPFDPTIDEQKQVAKLIKEIFARWASTNRADPFCWTPSVWFKPYRGSYFETA